ncbi:MAG: type II toxin-antitoxin system HipA family toxin [Betaproteobacteria bacterium]|nr:type II toxin-antitoxin system HipA family toxin [Betaproteobacteria bacterium]
MIALRVWAMLAQGIRVHAGDLAFGDPDAHGRYESEFEYSENWLAHPQAFDLDPESLRLVSGRVRYRSTNLYPPLAVFEDSLPDDWGRRLLVFDRRLPRREQGEPYLLREIGADGLGALSYSEHGEPEPRRNTVSAVHLEELVAAAARFEAGKLDDRSKLRRLLEAGSTPGGARPKALVATDDGEWIAKFPSRNRDGRFDVVGLEAAAMEIAGAAGLVVPQTRLAKAGRKRVLLVRRFDITQAGGRRHMVSLKTLCKERPGLYALSYGEAASAIRKHSAAPQEDTDNFYRHMVFNAVIGNTDDHLKNFWMLQDGRGFRLSPAFDLVPDIGERVEHALAFLYGQRSPTRAELLEIAGNWGVKRAEDILEQVLAATRGFRRVAKKLGVAEENIAEIGADIDARRKRCGS